MEQPGLSSDVGCGHPTVLQCLSQFITDWQELTTTRLRTACERAQGTCLWRQPRRGQQDSTPTLHTHVPCPAWAASPLACELRRGYRLTGTMAPVALTVTLSRVSVLQSTLPCAASQVLKPLPSAGLCVCCALTWTAPPQPRCPLLSSLNVIYSVVSWPARLGEEFVTNSHETLHSSVNVWWWCHERPPGTCVVEGCVWLYCS